jgi:hypothetical protein
MPCSSPHVRESQITVFIGDVDDLTEPGDGVTHVLSVGQRLFVLFRKCINVSWQVTLRREPSVFSRGVPKSLQACPNRSPSDTPNAIE